MIAMGCFAHTVGKMAQSIETKDFLQQSRMTGIEPSVTCLGTRNEVRKMSRGAGQLLGDALRRKHSVWG